MAIHRELWFSAFSRSCGWATPAEEPTKTKVLDAGIVLPDIDTVTLGTPRGAAQILRDAMLDGSVSQAEWEADHDLVNLGYKSPRGLTAQSRSQFGEQYT